MKKAVVVVPTYNEKDNIGILVKKILAQQEKIPNFKLHVLVSDSHSPDGTGKVVKALVKENSKVHYLDVVERGIGVGLIYGHEYAIEKLGADVLLQIDADGQHNPNDVPRFLKEITKGYNFVFGSRLIPGGKNQIEWYRQFFTWGSSIVCRILTGLFAVHDFTPNFRAFTKELFLKIDKTRIPWRAKSFIIQPSFLYEAISAGAKYKEIPIVFTRRGAGYSKNQVLAYAGDIFRFGLKARWKKSSTFFKFCAVGTVGYLINAFFLWLFANMAFPEWLAWGSSTEMAIISNFTLNNLWTFRKEKILGLIRVLKKFFQFNLTSGGALIIQTVFGTLGTKIFGTQYRQLLLPPIIIFLVVPYNYFMYTRIIWRKKR
jgi:dolichol-phosphate mannosyltransferase